MNHYFVPNYTAFNDAESYLKAYAVCGDRLQNLKIPAHIITSADDPVVDITDFLLLDPQPLLEIEITRYGGHCGFIRNLKLDSWIDDRITALLSGRANDSKSPRQSELAALPLRYLEFSLQDCAPSGVLLPRASLLQLWPREKISHSVQLC